MAEDKVRYVLDVDDKGTPKLVKFGAASEKAGKQASKAFDGAGKAVTDFADQIPGASNALSMFSAGPAAAAGTVIAGLAVGFAGAMKKSIDFADQMNDLSLRLGVSTEQLSVLSLYAEQSGTDIETLASAMSKLGVKISEGDANLKKYGVTAGTADEALFQLADKIAATEDPMLRLKIATDAFGKSGQQMLPLLVQGGEALRQMSDSTPIVSAEMAKMADNVNDKFAELEGRLLGIGLGIAEKIIPQIEIWLDGIDRIRQAMGLLSADEEYQKTRLEARNKIIKTYGDLMEENAKGAKLLGREAGPVKVGGLTLRESLAAFDRNNPTARPQAPKPPSPVGGFGAGATPKAAAGKASEVDFSEIDLEWQKTHGGWFNSETTAPPDPPDYYANIPLSEKAMKSLEDQRKKADEIAAASIQWQNDQIVGMANSASGVLADSFLKIGDGVDDMMGAMVDGFSQMLARMVAELAANALIFGFLSAVAPGAAGGFQKGLGGLSGLFLGGGKAAGGLPDVGVPELVGERRAELIIPRGPTRVEPTAGGGDVYHINVTNPAEARSLVRSLREDKRRRNTGVR